MGAAIRSSGIPREELFVTTKLWNADQGDEEAREALALSLERLGLDHVDLYLIHWPMPDAEQIVETWKAFEDFLDDGRARAIGVSNFRVDDLEILAEETDVRPAINQIELHPRFQQTELRRYHRGPRDRDRGVGSAGPGRPARRPGADRDRRGPRQVDRPR